MLQLIKFFSFEELLNNYNRFTDINDYHESIKKTNCKDTSPFDWCIIFWVIWFIILTNVLNFVALNTLFHLMHCPLFLSWFVVTGYLQKHWMKKISHLIPEILCFVQWKVLPKLRDKESCYSLEHKKCSLKKLGELTGYDAVLIVILRKLIFSTFF